MTIAMGLVGFGILKTNDMETMVKKLEKFQGWCKYLDVNFMENIVNLSDLVKVWEYCSATDIEFPDMEGLWNYFDDEEDCEEKVNSFKQEIIQLLGYNPY
jgi:hypothetical protein